MTLEEVLPNLMDGFEGFKTSMEKITADGSGYGKRTGTQSGAEGITEWL
jgi:hypothetical protein